MITHYEIDFDDLIVAQNDIIKRSIAFKIGWIITSLGGALTTFILVILVNKDVGSALTLSIPVFIIGFYIYPKEKKRQIISNLEKNKYKLIGSIKLTISNEVIHIERDTKEGDIISSSFKWTDVSRVKSDERRYFLYNSKNKGIIIKKSPFNINKEERYKFNTLIKNNLKKEGFNVK